MPGPLTGSDWAHLASLTVSLALVVAAAVRSYQLLGRAPIDRLHHPHACAARLKLAAMSITICLSLALTHFQFQFAALNPLEFFSTSTLSAATLAAFVFHTVHHNRSECSSDILLLYWPASSALSATLAYIAFGGDRQIVWVHLGIAVLAAFTAYIELQIRPPFHFLDLDNKRHDPHAHANIYSRLVFAWVTPSINKGYRTQVVTTDDLLPLPKHLQGEQAVAEFFKLWELELQKPTPSLLRALSKMVMRDTIIAGFILLVANICVLAQPLVLKQVIGFIQTYGTADGHSIEYGLFLVVLLALPSMVKAVAFPMHTFWLAAPWAQMCLGITALIHQKSLALSSESRAAHTVGQIVNYLTVDCERVSIFVNYVHNFWSYPLQIVVIIYLMYTTIGWSCLVGVLLIAASVYVNQRLTDGVGDSTRQMLSERDQRMRAVTETIGSIKTIKLYAWERAFVDKIEAIRNTKELAALRQLGIWKALITLVSSLTSVLISLLTFAVYTAFGGESHGPLTSQLIFVSIALFDLLQVPISEGPNTITMLAMVRTYYRRLSTFVTSTEYDKSAVQKIKYDRYAKTSTVDNVLVEISQGTFKWRPDEDNILENINIKCRREELVSIIGKVGSGKSSMISALLGDMVKPAGSVTVRGSVALVPQQSWIINATLRDNILFGNKLEQAFYDKVLDACALRADIEMLAGGDMTEIGEKGINLSGGQKARISLARAVYSRADVYLLDDPLSAVDAHVGKHIFNHVLGPNGLLKTRSRILATNALQYLSGANQIVMLSGGRIVDQGTFVQLAESKGEAFEFIQTHGFDADSSSLSGESDDDMSDTTAQANSVTSPAYAKQNAVRRTSLGRATADHSQQRGTVAHRIIKDEQKRVGSVGLGPYMHYIRASGTHNICILAAATICALCFSVSSSMWLAHWATLNDYDAVDPTHQPLYYLSVYSALGVAQVLSMIAVSAVVWLLCAVSGSKNTHAQMLQSVLCAPMSFFNSTPLGRILGLFSSDQSQIDENLLMFFELWVMAIIRISVALALIVVAMPLSLLFAIPVAYTFIGIQRRFMATSLEIRRLISTSRNLLITSSEEIVHGATTIRAYGRSADFEKGCAARNESLMTIWWTHLSTTRWLSCRLDLIAAVIVLSTNMSLITALYFFGSLDNGYASMALTNAISIIGVLNLCVRSFGFVELAMVSVERVRDYSNLDSEAPEVIEDHRPVEDWPEQGVVEFRNYSTRYREGLDLVLNGLSFRAQPKQKVGIVGRTGAGKSSLTLALFRIIESASGQILLDGEDISKYGLFDLRSRLSIIPQDPVLFAGTIRENLDPFGRYSDDEIWRALDNAHLGDTIRSKDERLEFEIVQGGENFSTGQRQLICLARALLKRAKVLVLDEATAAIDNATDAVIQESIRHEFSDCTVLTIAHRLNTVLDSDMILVIDKGQVAEFDSPQNLLANKSSIFAKLFEESKTRDSH